MRYANRLHTSDKRANEAISAAAVRARISISISDGIDPIGQGAKEGEASISGLVGKMGKGEKEAMRLGIVLEDANCGGGAGGLFSGDEWCAALEGLTIAAFDLSPTDDDGKYLFL